ncbi:hypothetical protein HHK36_009937 [Tetracentron sinense]|uniref:EF-hand domain-containing protein n=1 Tax=Tetracentron sinense TaxID=13715 RepID=A0A834ZGN4_TETSI|nr:hypothetical protein HHK36_009937 [Tetracentron sinense]
MPVFGTTYSNCNQSKCPPGSERFRDWVRSLDTNGDGQLSRQELHDAIRKLGLWFCGWRVRRAFAHADTDKNGFITEEEIVELENMPPYGNRKDLPAGPDERFRNWVRSIDTNGDGKISRQELQEAIRKLGLWFSFWRASRAFAHTDTDKNGFITEEEITELEKYAIKKQWPIVTS